MSFWCLQFFQKTNETIQLTVLRYLNWNCFRSFFGRIEDTKRTFRNQLTIKSPQTIIILYSKILDPWFHLLTCDRYSYSRKFSHFFLVWWAVQAKQKQTTVFISTAISCTANIFNVIFTVFKCVPISTVISLYSLHLIDALRVQWNNCKADSQFF